VRKLQDYQRVIKGQGSSSRKREIFEKGKTTKKGTKGKSLLPSSSWESAKKKFRSLGASQWSFNVFRVSGSSQAMLFSLTGQAIRKPGNKKRTGSWLSPFERAWLKDEGFPLRFGGREQGRRPKEKPYRGAGRRASRRNRRICGGVRQGQKGWENGLALAPNLQGKRGGRRCGA